MNLIPGYRMRIAKKIKSLMLIYLRQITSSNVIKKFLNLTEYRSMKKKNNQRDTVSTNEVILMNEIDSVKTNDTTKTEDSAIQKI